MKLDILQENLSSIVTKACRVLSSRPQMPILSHVLLEANEGKLAITASNMETTVSLETGAKVEAGGAFTVPGRTLAEIIGGLAAEKVRLTVNEGVLEITAGKFKAKINGLAASEYPKLTEIKEGKSNFVWTVGLADWLAIFSKVCFAAAADESRAALTGVSFRLTKDGLLTLAATDGFRLSVVRINSKNEEEREFIVPAKALLEVMRLAGEEKGEEKGAVKLVLGGEKEENQVLFIVGSTKIYSRLVSGKFPDFEKIIPAESTIRAAVATEELLKAVRLAAVFARDNANIIKFKILNLKFRIAAVAAQVGENEGEVEAKFEKGGEGEAPHQTVQGEGEAPHQTVQGEEEFAIAFNYKYLLDLLANCGSEEVVMEFNTPLTPGVFKIPGNNNFLHLIMPVRVQT